MTGTFLTTEGEATVYTVKTPENGTGAVIRLADVTGKGSDYALTFPKAVASAALVDASENAIGEISVTENTVRGSIRPYAIQSVLVRFAD